MKLSIDRLSAESDQTQLKPYRSLFNKLIATGNRSLVYGNKHFSMMEFLPNVTPLTTSSTGFTGNGRLLGLPLEELVFLQATSNYSWLHWKNGKKVLMARTLTYYQAHLPKAWFIRLHRNCVVNLLFVERLETLEINKGGLVYLRSGDVLPVSRRRLNQVKRGIARYQTSGSGMA